jgi:hypothetical protein
MSQVRSGSFAPKRLAKACMLASMVGSDRACQNLGFMIQSCGISSYSPRGDTCACSKSPLSLHWRLCLLTSEANFYATYKLRTRPLVSTVTGVSIVALASGRLISLKESILLRRRVRRRKAADGSRN